MSNSDQGARAEEESQSPLPFSTLFPGDRVSLNLELPMLSG